MNNSVTRWIGLGAGVVLLAAVTAFAVFLPKAEGAESIDLPDTLPGGYTSVELATPPADAGAPDDFSDTQAAKLEYDTQALRDVYGGSSASRTYVDETFQKQITLTYVDAAAGALTPPTGLQGPPPEGAEHPAIELKRAGDDVCTLYWAASQTSPDQQLQAVVCLRPVGEGALQVTTQSLSYDDTLTLADDLADQLG